MKIETSIVAHVLLLLLIGFVTGCDDETTPSAASDEFDIHLEEFLQQPGALGARRDDLQNVIDHSDLSDGDKRFILDTVNRSGYQYITVRRFHDAGVEVLELNRFNYDIMTHSITGEQRKSPHGSLTRYEKVGDKWEARRFSNYGG